jgi:hypothetical protein
MTFEAGQKVRVTNTYGGMFSLTEIGTIVNNPCDCHSCESNISVIFPTSKVELIEIWGPGCIFLFPESELVKVEE